jgi:O-antigen ligase
VALVWLGLTLVRGHRSRRLVAVLVVLWAGMSAALFFASPYGETALGRLALLLSGGDVLIQRRAAATVGVRIVLDNPVLGLGYLGVNRVAEQYGAADYVHDDPEQARGFFTAQNQYLEVAADAGLLGLAAFLLFVLVLLRGLRPGGAREVQSDDVLAIRAFLIGMLVGNQGSVWMLHLSIAGYCFFAAAGLAERLVERAASQRATPLARSART